jgi:hypothetical protein
MSRARNRPRFEERRPEGLTGPLHTPSESVSSASWYRSDGRVDADRLTDAASQYYAKSPLDDLERLKQTLGSDDPDFVWPLTSQLIEAGSAWSRNTLEFMLAVIRGIKPRDQLETMLAAQMAATHCAAMRFAEQIGSAKFLAHQDSAASALHKLSRTFASQMEALKRYRTVGEQKVTVRHVAVNDGGQAIVGTVNQPAPMDRIRAPANPPPALTDSRQLSMEAVGENEHAAVPVNWEQQNGE